MLGTRYEEYTAFSNNLPFRLSTDIEITSSVYSHEANWHDNLEIQLCTEGQGVVMLDEKVIPFQKNDIIVVNSNVIHHTNTADRLKYACLIIDTQFCRQIDIDPISLQFSSKIESRTFLNFFKTLIDLYGNNAKVCRTATLNKIMIEMLIELREKYTLAENTHTIRRRSFESVKSAIKFIRTNYERKLSLDEISENVLTDKYTLSREFKKITGQTIVQYINGFRCRKAAEYISDGHSVSDAAYICGFTNMSFFTKTFKSHMGTLPSMYKISRIIKIAP